MVINNSSALIDSYEKLISPLPHFFQEGVSFLLLLVLIVLYSVFVWKFYQFIAKKNILDLNLKEYKKSKFIKGVLYLVEYIIILPFMIFFWFSIFSVFLIFFSEDLNIRQILLISAIIISAIRITSYYSEDLSKELSKLLPFTLLAIAMLKPDFFSIERIFKHISNASLFLENVLIYFIFIIILETILRFFDLVFSLFWIEDDEI